MDRLLSGKFVDITFTFILFMYIWYFKFIYILMFALFTLSRYDTLSHHIRFSSLVRKWFAANALLNPSSRLGEYILMAPSPEVRTVFVKLVVFFCHFAIADEPLAGYEGSNLCEQILISVLDLLKCEAVDYGKHLPHYFSLFSMYVGLGTPEKQQLLKVFKSFFVSFY